VAPRRFFSSPPPLPDLFSVSLAIKRVFLWEAGRSLILFLPLLPPSFVQLISLLPPPNNNTHHGFTSCSRTSPSLADLCLQGKPTRRDTDWTISFPSEALFIVRFTWCPVLVFPPLPACRRRSRSPRTVNLPHLFFSSPLFFLVSCSAFCF